MLFHGCRQDPAAIHIHIPVAERVGDRLPNGFQPGEMNHTIHGSRSAEGLIHRLGVADIPLHQGQLG